METHSKEYNTRASSIPQQNQLYEGRIAILQNNQQQLAQPQNMGMVQRSVGQKPKASAKMPKARVLALANAIKRGLVVASIVSFGAFGGLVGLHQVSSTATAATTSSTTSQTTSSQKSSSFFKQSGNNFGSTTSSQGTTSTTNSTSTSTATPVTGSNVS